MPLPIDEQFLTELGFLPNGENLNEFGLTIFDHEVDEVDDDEPHIHLLFAMNTDEVFLEAYDEGGKSTLVTRIPTPRTREELVTLLKCLGSYRPTLQDHVSRELTAYMREDSERLGMGLRWFIDHSDLIDDCNAFPGDRIELIWSANADEQLGAYMADQIEAELISRTSHCEFDNVTVLRDKSEVIVYGGGSDWMVQYSKVTNGHGNFRRWFSDRTKATEYAQSLASETYRGHKAHQENPLAPMRDIGEGIINFVIDHKLVSAECPDSPGSGVMMVWSANAPEQIAQYVADYGYKVEADPLGG